MFKRTRYTEEEFKEAVKTSLSVSQTLTKLKLRPTGGNYKEFNKRVNKHNIDISHFTGQGWNVGVRYKKVVEPRSLKEILVENSYYGSDKLRRRLIEAKIKSSKCEKCNNSEWNNLPIPLELDHINGINTDNRIENLQILCPNCHAQTPTWRRRKK